MRYLFQFFCLILFASCAVTSYSSKPVTLGKQFDLKDLKQNPKGPILFQKKLAADWAADRGGLINLKDPKAKAASLQSGGEPIQIYFYVIDHPKFGRYLIDTGISEIFRKDQKEWPISWIVASAMNTGAFKVRLTAEEWLKKDPKKLEGIFLTHMHLDHILGSKDFQAGTPLYIGPQEATHKQFINSFVQGTTDQILGENPNLSELSFPSVSNDSSYPVLDFFGDQSLLIFHIEGHTKGSLAFLIQSSNGYQLVLGDSCHTAWGWENNVPPGDFTADQEKNKAGLSFLKDFAAKFTGIQVHPGHQSLSEKRN